MHNFSLTQHCVCYTVGKKVLLIGPGQLEISVDFRRDFMLQVSENCPEYQLTHMRGRHHRGAVTSMGLPIVSV